MKVAINRCFGGFGISNVGFEKLLERKGIAYEKVSAKYSFKNDTFDYYKAGFAGIDEHMLLDYDMVSDRTDADLIAVLEEMGEDAWSWAAEIKIVDIPDDVKWHIHEYDGLEHVAEDHRIWS
jgi:hypothetical protein